MALSPLLFHVTAISYQNIQFIRSS